MPPIRIIPSRARGRISGLEASALFLLLALGACAKPAMNADSGSSPYQLVSVHTPGVTGAHCFLQAGSRSYTLSTPGAVTVYRGTDPMAVTCFKGEHMVGGETVKPTMSLQEAEDIAGTAEDCLSCNYPRSITVALALAPSSLEVNLRQGP